MGRQSKIEKHSLQKLVADALAQGKSARQIAELCSKKARESISHVAVNEYIKTIDQGVRKAEVLKSSERVSRIVNFDIDILEVQANTTMALLNRFQHVAAKPIDEKTDDELRKDVQTITALNRELRENSKFMADMREKAFQFELWKEFTDLFIEIFRKAAPDACDYALAQVSANPRMQRIIELQLRGEG
ncbi:hypothetical protein [Gorillibacterium sp. sgz5001074]|uniref:hypothetical protein n=1 Tax=Gorillibacterium sp. sgz5001074 TaxID=3446695 RepID=UPI003F6661BC